MRDALRVRQCSIRTETSYLDWARRFILFHHQRHLETRGAPEITAVLTHLAVAQNVAASTQTQALSAILFLYREGLQLDFDELSPSSAPRSPNVSRLSLPKTKSKPSSVKCPAIIS